MIACLVMVGILASGPFPDRADFVRKLGQVGEGASMESVQKLLGRPDDILTAQNSDEEEGTTVWCYGTNGHMTLPTLGTVRFSGRKAGYQFNDRYADPPPTSLISEADLRGLLRKLHAPVRPRLPDDDPLWLIRAGNALIAAGKAKALAAIQESEQVESRVFNDKFYWLLRTVFEVPKEQGHFNRAPVGGYFVPEDNRKTPRHPIIMLDDVPLSIYMAGPKTGGIASISGELNYIRKNCELRTSPLIPPDDPFETYQKILKSSLWPFPPFDPKKKTRFRIPYAEEEGHLLRSLLYLVRTAYRAKEMGTYSYGYVNGLDVEKYHQQFLATGARWDPDREMYIPADGKPLLDDSRFFKPITWRPLQGDTEVKVWLRRTDAKSVDWGMEVTVKSGSAFGCFLVVRDTETGEPINLGSPVNEARVQAEKERATKTRIDGDWRSSSFSCQEGRSVTLELFQGPVTVFRKTVVP